RDVESGIDARLGYDDRTLVFGDPGHGDLATDGMTEHQPETAGDLEQAAIGDRELRVGFRLHADDQLRVLVRILGVAMMIPVIQAVIFVWQSDHETREIADREIERAAPERGL